MKSVTISVNYDVKWEYWSTMNGIKALNAMDV